MLANFLVGNVYAQEAAQGAAQGQPSAIMQFMPLILIGLVFYFLIIRPQKKKMKDEQTFVNALQKDVDVYTKFGVLGKIVGITDKVVTLEIADGVKIKVLRTQIAGFAGQIFDAQAPSSK